jgi:hypothetical protein
MARYSGENSLNCTNRIEQVGLSVHPRPGHKKARKMGFLCVMKMGLFLSISAARGWIYGTKYPKPPVWVMAR